MTVAEWVRQVLRAARHFVTHGDAARKLVPVRAAAALSFPAPGIGQVGAEIERGYGAGAAH
ncbi:MAG TPA: hypothetical protein VNK67_08055 [Burkholderiales bacterium]|nr:hypothetical protein [Burkholderiales bacterium]